MAFFRQDLFENYECPSDSLPVVHLAIVCGEAFVREAIAETMDAADRIKVFQADTLSCLQERHAVFEVILYIEPLKDDPSLDETLMLVEEFAKVNWILMSHDRCSRMAVKLLNVNTSVSFIPFDVSKCDLVHIVRLAANHRRVFLDRFCQFCAPSEMGLVEAAGLTSEQRHLLQQLSEGHSNKAIAIAEGLTESAIKMRVRCLLSKMGATNRTHAAVIAARAGLRGNQLSRNLR